MALTQISTDGIKNGTITGSDLATNVDLVDNQKLRLGTGNDLQIYHSGTNSFIDDQGTGNLYIKSNQFEVANANGLERMAKFIQDGAVELYYDNSKKFETTSTGATVTGDLLATGLFKSDTAGEGLHNTATGAKFFSNNSNDTHLEHGSNAQVKLSFIAMSSTYRGAVSADASAMHLLTGASGEQIAVRCVADGTTELRHSGSKKFETLTDGVKISGKTLSLINPSNFQDSTFTLEHGSSTVGNKHTIDFKDQNGSSTQIISYGSAFGSSKDNALEIKTSTTSNGDPTTRLTFFEDGKIQLPDNGKATFGTGDDLQIYHNGSHSFIDNNTGDLNIESSAVLIKANNTENAVSCLANGAVELYYDNSKKLETTNAGVSVSGASDGVLNLDTSDSRGAFVRFGQGGSFHNMVGCADGLTNGDKEDLGVRAADNIIFASGGSSERMRIDSSGRLGIGTTSPSVTLDIEATTPTIRLTDSDASGTPESEISGGGGDLKFSADRDNENSNTIIQFLIDGTERMRILNNSRIGFATTSTTGLGSQTGNANVCTFNFAGVTLTQYGVTAGFYYDRLNFTNSQYFIVNSSGTGVYLGNGSTSFTAHSDERLKENITELDGTKAYNHVKTARAASFKWKATGYPTDTKIGFIAQDWEINYPEVTNSTTEIIDEVENPKGIQYTETIPVLMAALKQAIIKIETLETEVAALKAA